MLHRLLSFELLGCKTFIQATAAIQQVQASNAFRDQGIHGFRLAFD